MKSETLRTIETTFKDLIHDKGFRKIAEDQANTFDDAFVIYSTDDIKLRLISDKSIPAVDISSAKGSEDWFDLNLVRNLVEKNDILTVAKPEELALFCTFHYSSLQEMFTSQLPFTRKILRDLKKQRARRMFPNAFR